MKNHFEVVIFSSRAATDAGTRAIRQWLCQHGFPGAADITVTDRKLPASLLIDDRAFRFDAIFPGVDTVLRLCERVDVQDDE